MAVHFKHCVEDCQKEFHKLIFGESLLIKAIQWSKNCQEEHYYKVLKVAFPSSSNQISGGRKCRMFQQILVSVFYILDGIHKGGNWYVNLLDIFLTFWRFIQACRLTHFHELYITFTFWKNIVHLSLMHSELGIYVCWVLKCNDINPSRKRATVLKILVWCNVNTRCFFFWLINVSSFFFEW